jgi:hypothetical protein
MERVVRKASPTVPASPMGRPSARLGACALAVALVVSGSAVAREVAGGAPPLPGDLVLRAGDVALAHTGSGSVTETEVEDDDEGGHYEVEVRLDGGARVDVHLDRAFTVTSVEASDRHQG